MTKRAGNYVQARQYVLFIDEVHRFSKTQQGAAARGREPAGHADRRNHGEPELLGHIAIVVTIALADLKPLGDEDISNFIDRALKRTADWLANTNSTPMLAP